MKKITLFLFALATLLVVTSAQAQTAGRNKYLNAGIGLGAYTAGGIPIGASFEVDVKDNISVGGFFDYARYGYRYGGYRWNYNFLYFGARGSYHLGQLLRDLDMSGSKWDPYAGVSLGIRTASYSDNTGTDTFTSPYSGGAFLGIHAGSRYMFSDKAGAFAEVGYGVSALRLGFTAKF
jgi:hypothetical protein